MFGHTSIWTKKGMTWNEWRSYQADLALHYYLQNSSSAKNIARQFKISENALR